MSEETKETAKREPVTRTFIVRCEAEDANGELEVSFMDTVSAYDEEDVKDFMTGWMAERGFIVKRWIMIGDLEKLRRIARNL